MGTAAHAGSAQQSPQIHPVWQQFRATLVPGDLRWPSVRAWTHRVLQLDASSVQRAPYSGLREAGLPLLFPSPRLPFSGFPGRRRVDQLLQEREPILKQAGMISHKMCVPARGILIGKPRAYRF